MFSYCLKGATPSVPFPVYITCLSHPVPLRALPPGLEGGVELFGDVPDVLTVSVGAAAAGDQHWD